MPTRLLSLALLLTSPILLLAAHPPASATTSSQPATAPAPFLQLDTLKALPELAQAGIRLHPDIHGIYHLRPAPFGLHILGNADSVALVASPSLDLAKKFALQKEPIVLLGGTGAAYDDHELFLQKDAALVPLDDFNKPQLWGDLMPAIKDTLKKEINGPLLVLNVPFQALRAEDHAKEFTSSITSFYLFDGTLLDPPKSHEPSAPIPWAKTPQSVSLILFLYKSYNQYQFDKTTHLPLQLQFDLP